MFSKNSRYISYDTNTGILSAECLADDQQWCQTWLNINDCLAWQSGKIVPYRGPRESYDCSLVNFKAAHELRNASFSGTTISFKVEKEGDKNKTRWDELVHGGPHWNGIWKSYEGKYNLDDNVRNKNGILEFVSEDKELPWFWKMILEGLKKIPAPNTRAIVISTAVEDKARQDGFAKKAKSQEDWLKNTYVEGNQRIVRGVKVEKKA